jgi:hypothetical protein
MAEVVGSSPIRSTKILVRKTKETPSLIFGIEKKVFYEKMKDKRQKGDKGIKIYEDLY